MRNLEWSLNENVANQNYHLLNSFIILRYFHFSLCQHGNSKRSRRYSKEFRWEIRSEKQCAFKFDGEMHDAYVSHHRGIYVPRILAWLLKFIQELRKGREAADRTKKAVRNLHYHRASPSFLPIFIIIYLYTYPHIYKNYSINIQNAVFTLPIFDHKVRLEKYSFLYKKGSIKNCCEHRALAVKSIS